MKKLIFLLASAGMLLTACIAEDSGMQEQIGEAVIIGATYEAPEEEPGTRSIIDIVTVGGKKNGLFYWSEGDSLNVFATRSDASFAGNVFEIYNYSNKNRSKNATFIGYDIPGRATDVAVCPARLNPVWENGTLTVYLPETIRWVAGEADPYMVASDFSPEQGNNKNLSFKHIGGLIKLTITDMDKDARKLAVTIYGARITGVYEVTKDAQGYYNIAAESIEGGSTVTFVFTGDEVDADGMTFYVPVPVMTYSKISFSVLTEDGDPLFTYDSSEDTRTVARKQIKSFPSISFMGGSGESDPSYVITTTSGQTGTVELPSTTNDVLVRMNSTSGEITLNYEDNNNCPQNVYITVLKDATVNSLNVNLPNSTVYINGEANSNLGTLNSTTSPNTLRVQKSPLTIGTATINKGNANIEGTVNSIVVASGATSGDQVKQQVQIFVSKDAALQTVTLNAQTDVVVEQPKDQIAVEATENKVYVIVNAEGSTATAQNGGDIYVTANANCSVTAGGGESEDPSKESTATIDNYGSGNVSTDQKTGGEIETGDLKKVQRGDTKYATLAAALAEADNGDTITFLVDYDATNDQIAAGNSYYRFPITKSLIIDGNNHNLTVIGRGLAPGMDATSNVDITFKDINIRNSTNGARCIDTRGHIGTLTLDNAKLDVTGATSTYPTNVTQPLTIGGPISSIANVVIKNGSSIMTNVDATAYYAIITFNPVNMTITNSSVMGWAALYFKGASGSAGSNGSTVTIDHSTITSNNIYSGNTNAFAAFTFEDSNISVDITNSSININDSSDQKQGIACFEGTANNTVTLGNDNTVTLNGDKAVLAFKQTTTSKLSVTGGTFNVDPSEFVAPGYVATPSGNVWTVAPISGVAAIGTQGYETLTAAFAAVQNNETITMLADVALTDRIFVNAGANPAYAGTDNRYATTSENKSITLDLNGKNITTSSNIALAGGTLNIKSSTDATISTSADGLAPVEVRGTGDLANKRTLTVGENVTLTGSTYGLNVFGSNDDKQNFIEVNIDGTVNGTLFVLGNLKNTANEITINVNGTVNVTAKNNDMADVGIALNGYATVTVGDNANVSGESGIEVRAGVLTVNGGTISGTADGYSCISNGSGSSTKGAAIAVVQHTTALPISATINGGTTLTGEKQLAVANPENTAFNNVSVLIPTTLASSTETVVVPDSFGWKNNGNGTSTLVKAVAQIGTEIYATLQEAIDACPTDGTETTINVIANDLNADGFELRDNTSGRNVIIDFGGHTYNVVKNTVGSEGTRTQCMHFASNNTLTLKNGTITSDENVFKQMMQNYCHLTIDNMTIDCSNAITQTYGDYSNLPQYAFWSFKTVPVFNFNLGSTGSVVRNSTITFKSEDNTGLVVDDGSCITLDNVTINGYVTVASGSATITGGSRTGVNAAAKIGDTYYSALPDAFAAANATTGATITLLKNCETGSDYTKTNPLNISGTSTTLDLNGKTLTVTNNFSFAVTANNVTVTNGTLASGANSQKATNVNSYILVAGAINKTDQITGVTISGVTTTGGGISIGGSEDSQVKGIAEATISGCTVLSGDYYAICSQNNSTITINSGTYTSNQTRVNSGVGQLSPGVIHGYFVGNDGPEGMISVTGGTFYGAISSSNANLVSITGGAFSSEPTAFLASGHIAVYSAEDHLFTVEAAEFWEDAAVSDSEFASITDEVNKTITISTAAQLAKLAKNVNAHVKGVNDFIYKGYTVNLEADIDLAGKIWTPIGVCTDWTFGHFSGTFNGNNHTISNMKVVREDRAGLFGSIYGEAVIKDLNVTNVTLVSNHFAGGIVGWINEENYDLVIDNCTVVGGTITVLPEFVDNKWDNGDKCGGIVGYSNANTGDHCKIINNKAENLTITAYRDCAGIVGCCQSKNTGIVYVGNNTVKDVILVQDNYRAYQSSVTTVHEIIGRTIDNGSTSENNTATNVVINTVNP